jgi:hypothetical protein
MCTPPSRPGSPPRWTWRASRSSRVTQRPLWLEYRRRCLLGILSRPQAQVLVVPLRGDDAELKVDVQSRPVQRPHFERGRRLLGHVQRAVPTWRQEHLAGRVRIERLRVDRVDGNHRLAVDQGRLAEAFEPVLGALHGIRRLPALIFGIDDGGLGPRASKTANVLNTAASGREALAVHAVSLTRRGVCDPEDPDTTGRVAPAVNAAVDARRGGCVPDDASAGGRVAFAVHARAEIRRGG